MKSTIISLMGYPLMIGGLMLLLVACQDNPQDQVAEAPPQRVVSISGTALMIDSIQRIKKNVAFRNHPYESGEKVKLIEKEITAAQANKTLTAQMYVNYGKALLEAGRSQEAIQVFEGILARLPENQAINETTKVLHEALAISYMRLGEQTNCIENHSSESCLFPIKGQGVHVNQEGSRKAIQIYEALLKVFPEDLGNRWLLNLAYMTLGEYPSKVPAQFRIPSKVFQPEYNLPVFNNIAMNLGVDVNKLAGGTILDDFNNDGWIDIIASSWGLFGGLHYFENKGDGHFQDKTSTTGIGTLTGGLNLIQADYNNDGFLDFFVIRGAWRGEDWMGQLPNSLIKNNGDGTFEDVTIAAGLYAEQPTQAAVWLDFNADGWLDLFVGNETHAGKEVNASQLFLNRGDGTFTDVAPQLGLQINRYIKGVAAGDVNNDGLPDLYLSNIDGANFLLMNRGGTSIDDWRFENISQKANVREPLESFPTWFFDYDNDGWEDIFVASYDKFALAQQATETATDYLGGKPNSDYPRLYRNLGGEKFENKTEAVRLNRVFSTMGSNYGDLDNDGFLDFYAGTGAPDYRAIVPNRMFRNQAGQSFQDVTYAGNFGHIQKGHGVGFADLDNDGDQDIYTVLGGSYSGDVFQNALFENPGNDHQWITIRLRGTVSNRAAIGARLKITTVQNDGTTRDFYRTLSSGGSFGANSLQQEIGLSKAKSIENIAISWPDGKFEYINYGTAPINSVVQIVEGQPKITKIEQGSFQFPQSGHGHHVH